MKNEICPLMQFVGYLATLGAPQTTRSARSKQARPTERWQIKNIFEEDGAGDDFSLSMPHLVIEMTPFDSMGAPRRIEADIENIFFASDKRCLNVGKITVGDQVITLLHCEAGYAIALAA